MAIDVAKQKGAHAEVTALNAAQEAGATPVSLGVSGQKICDSCARTIIESGGRITGPYTAEWP